MVDEKIQLTVYYPESLYRKIQAEAAAQDVSFQDYNRAALQLGSAILADVLPRVAEGRPLKGRVDAVIQILGAQTAFMVAKLLKPIFRTTEANEFGAKFAEGMEELLS